MKTLRELLTEGAEKRVVMAFGRMNPPTIGHAKLVEKVRNESLKQKADHSIVLSHSQDSKKNPLTAEQKLQHAQRFFPGANLSVASKEMPTLMHHAANLHKRGYHHLTMVAGSDRVDEYKNLLNKYNGKFDDKGNGYHFKSINVVSAGDRDPDAEGASGMSASKMREHAKNNDFESFRKGIPPHVNDTHAHELFKHVRSGMQLHEERDRELYMTGRLFNVGDSVEDLVTEETGTIEYRGTNYVTVKVGDTITKRWLDEVLSLVEPKTTEEAEMADMNEAHNVITDIEKRMKAPITWEKAGHFTHTAREGGHNIGKLYYTQGKWVGKNELGYAKGSVAHTDLESAKRNFEKHHKEHFYKEIPVSSLAPRHESTNMNPDGTRKTFKDISKPASTAKPEHKPINMPVADKADPYGRKNRPKTFGQMYHGMNPGGMVNKEEFSEFDWDSLNEAVEISSPHKKMLKTIGMPNTKSSDIWSGTRHVNEKNHDKTVWSVRGGHAGAKVIDRMRDKALAAGFKKAESTDSHSPDGSVFHGGTVYKHPDGHVLHLSKTYGETKAYNSFRAEYHHAKQMKEEFEELLDESLVAAARNIIGKDSDDRYKAAASCMLQGSCSKLKTHLDGPGRPVKVKILQALHKHGGEEGAAWAKKLGYMGEEAMSVDTELVEVSILDYMHKQKAAANKAKASAAHAQYKAEKAAADKAHKAALQAAKPKPVNHEKMDWHLHTAIGAGFPDTDPYEHMARKYPHLHANGTLTKHLDIVAKKNGFKHFHHMMHDTWEEIAKENPEYHHLAGTNNPYHHHEETDPLMEAFKKGDKVAVTAGPHKGVPHEIIHVHTNGDYNVRPIGLAANHIQYRQGAVRATAEQVRKIIDESTDSGFNHRGVKNFKPGKEEVEREEKARKERVKTYNADRKKADAAKTFKEETINEMDDASVVAKKIGVGNTNYTPGKKKTMADGKMKSTPPFKGGVKSKTFKDVSSGMVRAKSLAQKGIASVTEDLTHVPMVHLVNSYTKGDKKVHVWQNHYGGYDYDVHHHNHKTGESHVENHKKSYDEIHATLKGQGFKPVHESTQPLDEAAFSTLLESAPPGMEHVVKTLKKKYPDDKGKAFAIAWSMYNKKHVHESMASKTDVLNVLLDMANIDKGEKIEERALEISDVVHDVPASAQELQNARVVGAYHINGKTVKLLQMGNFLAPVVVVLEEEPWRDADGSIFRFNGQSAALQAIHALLSGGGSHVPAVPEPGSNEEVTEEADILNEADESASVRKAVRKAIGAGKTSSERGVHWLGFDKANKETAHANLTALYGKGQPRERGITSWNTKAGTITMHHDGNRNHLVAVPYNYKTKSGLKEGIDEVELYHEDGSTINEESWHDNLSDAEKAHVRKHAMPRRGVTKDIPSFATVKLPYDTPENRSMADSIAKKAKLRKRYRGVNTKTPDGRSRDVKPGDAKAVSMYYKS